MTPPLSDEPVNVTIKGEARGRGERKLDLFIEKHAKRGTKGGVKEHDKTG